MLPNPPANEERNQAMICHLSPLAMYVVPGIGVILGPLLAWILLKERSAFADDQGKEALNFQISLVIYGLLLGLLALLSLGSVGSLGGLIALLMFGLPVVQLVFMVVAVIASNKGERYRYPFSIRLVK